MRKFIAIAATSVAVLAAATAAPVTAQARNGGEIAAGIIGGLAAGAILGAAIAPHPSYYGAYDGPAYDPPAGYSPSQADNAASCYWAPGRPYWDGYRWVQSRVQVCD